MLKKVNAGELDKEIEKGLTLVKYFADWCGPCVMIKPIVEEVSKEMTNIKFITFDIEEDKVKANAMGVSSLPTMILYRDGKPIETIIGFMPKEAIIDKITAAIK